MVLQFSGRGLWNILKAIVWLVVMVLRLALELLKVFLLLFAFVARVFLVFVKMAVPD